MDLKDLFDNHKNIPTYQIERRLNKLVRENYRYKNLDENNKKLVFEIIKKQRENIRKGIGLTHIALRDEMYKLYRGRIKLDLTEEDLKDIKEILEIFRK